MKLNEAKLVIDRLDNVLSCMRCQYSGADVHTVGNIRHTAQMLKQQLESDPECLQEELAKDILKNVESDMVKFFQKKYPSRNY